MFRVKTTRRNVKRATSPIRPATDVSGVVFMDTSQTNTVTMDVPKPAGVAGVAGVAGAAGAAGVAGAMERNVNSYFEAESAAVLLSKPWLRLERGLRLQKYRIFANTYPGLTEEEREALYKVLVKANDAKPSLLNTKQQITYENGVIQSIKGLKMIRNDLNTATFKIEVVRPTKKNLTDDS